jgi:hypothetical protein
MAVIKGSGFVNLRVANQSGISDRIARHVVQKEFNVSAVIID